MIPMFLLFCLVALLRGFFRFIVPLPVTLAHPRESFQRVLLRKTRRGWESVSRLFCRHMDDLAWNATAEVKLSDDDLRAMACELMDLDHDADDATIQETFSAFGDETDADKSANAVAAQQRKQACEALGIAANAKPEELHAAILAVPTRLKEATDLAVNARKAQSKLLLDSAINEGRITQAERAALEIAFNSDFTAASVVLAAATPKLNAQGNLIQGLGSRKQITSNARELDTQAEVACNALVAASNGKLDRRAAWQQLKADPKFKTYFETQPAAE